MKKTVLRIDGMSCSACSNGLEKYLNKQEKIKSAEVNLVMQTATISHDDSLSIKDLEKFISDAGFESLGEENLFKEEKNSYLPLLVYGVLGFVLMYISMSHMLKIPLPSFLNMKSNPISYSLTLLILTILFLFYGWDIIKSGYKNLYHKMPNMDTLVTIGIISSFIYSLFSTIMILFGHLQYLHSLYFESTAFVIYFIKLGRFIDKKSKNKTKDAIRDLVQITPEKARIKKGDSYEEITIDEVKKEDILICLPGDKIAVDGEIIKGESHFDESFITGESLPVLKKQSDKVIAGSINYEGAVEYKAERIGKESTISEIVRLVVEATNTKAPISRIADKVSGVFVPLVIVLASITFLINLLLGTELSNSLTHFISVLVVACPCSLGLATPLAMVISIGIAAKKGILVKNNEVLELASKIDVAVFDKTGTLTNGNLSVSKINNHSDYTEKELLEILGSIEKNSIHPIAKGINSYLKENKIKANYDFITEDLAGFGIKAKDDKDIYYACNASLLKKLDITNAYPEEEKLLTSSGNSIIYLVKNNKVIASFGLKDTVRKEAKRLVSELEKRNIEVVMLTGDNKITANKIAAELKIKNVLSEAKPKEKTAYIKKIIKEDKKVIMVGDGINDAPSLSSATIGISLKGATDIATSSADVIIVNNNLLKIIDLFDLSRKTIKNIKENLFWAFIYNIIMIPMAMGIIPKLHINPMVACLAMIISSLTVTLNALRLKSIR